MGLETSEAERDLWHTLSFEALSCTCQRNSCIYGDHPRRTLLINRPSYNQ